MDTSTPSAASTADDSSEHAAMIEMRTATAKRPTGICTEAGRMGDGCGHEPVRCGETEWCPQKHSAEESTHGLRLITAAYTPGSNRTGPVKSVRLCDHASDWWRGQNGSSPYAIASETRKVFLRDD